jgi:hypothetical protein
MKYIFISKQINGKVIAGEVFRKCRRSAEKYVKKC